MATEQLKIQMMVNMTTPVKIVHGLICEGFLNSTLKADIELQILTWQQDNWAEI